jgi:hypothetical protein
MRDAHAQLLAQPAELDPAPSVPEEPEEPAVSITFTASPAPAEVRTPAVEAADGVQ